jgi:hypothetical protein
MAYGLWYYAWGVDSAYARGNLQTRVEYLETYRQMPIGAPSADNRQGGYLQVGYFLNGWRAPRAPEVIAKYLDKSELLVRYQRAVVADEISTIPRWAQVALVRSFLRTHEKWPSVSTTGSPPRSCGRTNLTLGCRAEAGYVNTFGGHSAASAMAAGATANDRAFPSQFAIGF